MCLYLIFACSAALSCVPIHRCAPLPPAPPRRWSVRGFRLPSLSPRVSSFFPLESVVCLMRRPRFVAFFWLFLPPSGVRKAIVLRTCLRFDRIARRRIVDFTCRWPLLAHGLLSTSLLFSPCVRCVVLFLRPPSCDGGPCSMFCLFRHLLFSPPPSSSLSSSSLHCSVGNRTSCALSAWLFVNPPASRRKEAGKLCRHLLKRVSHSTCHSFSVVRRLRCK